MESIRQRRRNRHKVKQCRKLASKRLYLTLNIDVSGVNAAFAQIKNVMTGLSKTMALPEFKKAINEAQRSIIASFSPDVIRGMISTQKSAQNHLYDAWRYQEGCRCNNLGDPSCKFNARSPLIQCAVNPSGNCAACRFFET